jgi:glucosamine--fructose-6-phosphate aminotransferase (isomerizing)
VRILWDPIMAEKGGYRHFMLKEMYEQPRAITDTFRGRISAETGNIVLPDVNLDPSVVRSIQRVVFVACGTASYASLLGRAMVERLAGLPAEVDLGSEFRYRDPVAGPETLIVAVSQSGETADTLGAVKTARQKGCPILAITNVVGSALSREATGTLYMHAGPEKRIRDLVEIPRLVEQTLELDGQIAALARHLSHATDFLYLGRGLQYPIALEGALKLKELSYIHAEGYAGGEMKHGPIALISDGFPVVALAPRDSSYERMLGNIEEVRARDGQVIAVVQQGDRHLASRAQHLIEVPAAAEMLMPLITVVPLQLLAYHIAVRRGCDVDQPRNLAKSRIAVGGPTPPPDC